MKNLKVSHIMNRSLSYIKDQYPIKLLSEIFRNYTKSLYRFRRSISLESTSQNSGESNLLKKTPAAAEICGINQFPVQRSSSKDSVKITWSNNKFKKTASASSVSLPRESSEDIKEKPSKKSHRLARTPKSALKREYPWQNFNIDVQKHRVKSVNSRKLNLKKTNSASKYFKKEPIIPIFCTNKIPSCDLIDSNHILNGNVLMEEDIRDEIPPKSLNMEQTTINLGTSNSEEVSIVTDELDEVISESTPNLMIEP